MATTLMSISTPRFGSNFEQMQNVTADKLKHTNAPDTNHDVVYAKETNADNRDCNKVQRRKSRYDRLLVDRYKLIRTIGTGNFAKVKLACHLITGMEVAIKIIDKTHLNASSRRKLTREVRLMKLLNHPNIVRLLEIIETDKIMYLVMEYASGGELYEYLFKNGRMTEDVARAKFRQILSAVQYCHQKKIIHRDLKTENLLLDENLNIKLADFGFANEFHEGTKLNTFCGSPPYAAPELFRGKEYDGPEVDVWSLGVILFKLVSGALPFDGHSLSELRENVLRGRYRIPFYMSTDCEKLLKKMLVLNPAKRHSIEALMKDRWVNIGYEDNPLCPYREPKLECTDPVRITKMMNMGYNLDQIVQSLKHAKFDEITATYHLLINKSNDAARTDKTSCIRDYVDEGRFGGLNNQWTTRASNSGEMVYIVREKNTQSKSPQTTPSDNPIVIDSTETNPASEAITTHVIREVSPQPSNAQGDNSGPARVEQIIIIRDQINNDHTENDHKSGSSSEHLGELSEKQSANFSPTDTEMKDKLGHKQSGIHWCPTAGVAVRNGRTSLDDGKGMPTVTERIGIVRAVEQNSSQEQTNDAHLVHIVDEKSDEKLSRRISVEFETDNTTADMADSSDVKKDPNSRVYFGRLNPIRQTMHSTNRPQIEQQLYGKNRTSGIGESRNTKATAARVNLSQIKSDDTGNCDNSARETNKQRNFFRSFTSRFSKRSHLPLGKHEDSTDTVQSQSETERSGRAVDSNSVWPTKPVNLSRAFTVRVERPSGRPVSHLSTGNTRIGRVSDDSGVINSRLSSEYALHGGTGGGGGLTDPPMHDNSPLGFIRSLALRFSKKKYGDTGMNQDTRDMNNSIGSSESSKIQSSISDLPPFPIRSRDKIGPEVESSRSDGRKLVQNVKPDSRPSSFPCQSKENVDKPRVLRFKWYMKITSKLPPEELVNEIIRVLDENDYVYERRGKFLFICECMSQPTMEYVKWEMEVCELPRQVLYGIRFQKLYGTTAAFKLIMNTITQTIRL